MSPNERIAHLLLLLLFLSSLLAEVWQRGTEQGGINARRGCQKGERGCVPHSKGGRWRQEISCTTARSSIAKRESIRRSGISLVSTSSQNCGPPPEPQKTLQHGPYSIFPLLEVSLSFSWPLSALLALKSKYPIVDTHTHKTEKERDRNNSRRRKKGGERRRRHTASFSFFVVGWLVVCQTGASGEGFDIF